MNIINGTRQVALNLGGKIFKTNRKTLQFTVSKINDPNFRSQTSKMADWTLRNHLEKHKEILDTLFYICDDIERSRTVIRLLMKILSKEQEVTFSLMMPSIHLEDNQSSPDQHSINVETEFFPNAASTCAYEVANANQKVFRNSILTPGVPEVLKVDQNSDSYVPDTCLMEDIGDKEIHDSQKDFNLTIVPETQDAFPETETSNSKSMNLERRVQHFDNICSDITETFGDPNPHREIKTERKSEEQLKDEAIREKYPPLSVSTKSTASGSCDNSANDTLAANSDCESPSILSNYSRKNGKRKYISPPKDNELNEDDDFKTPFSTVSSSSFCEEPKRKKRPPSKQPSLTTMKSATNSYGMTVTVATDSQLAKTHNMKQSNIKDIFTKGVRKILEFFFSIFLLILKML